MQPVSVLDKLATVNLSRPENPLCLTVYNLIGDGCWGSQCQTTSHHGVRFGI